jgi:hypothetical protein
MEDNEKLKNTIITLSKKRNEDRNVKKENILLKKQLYQIQTDHPEMFS